MIDWAIANNIRIAAAAPHHQQQNGLCEWQWQAKRLISFKLLVDAQLTSQYTDVALLHATLLDNLLPVHHVTIELPDGSEVPATPK